MASFCPECGTAREGAAETCANCEYRFSVATSIPPEIEEEETSLRPKWLSPKWIGAGIGAIALTTAAVWIGTSEGGFSSLVSSTAPAVDISLLPVSFGGKCGYVDASGKMAINPQYDNALAFHPELNVAPVLVAGKWGLIDREGKYVVNPQFDSLSIDKHFPSISVTLGGKAGTIDASGKFVINPQFDYMSSFDGKGIAIAKVGNKLGIIDSKGTHVIHPQFDNIYWNYNWDDDNPDQPLDLMAQPLLVVQDNKFGFADKTGKLVIQPQFVQASSFDSSGYAPAAIEETDTAAFERIKNENARYVTNMIQQRISNVVSGTVRVDSGNVSFDINNLFYQEQVWRWLLQNTSRDRWVVEYDTVRDPNGQILRGFFKLTQQGEPPKKNRVGYIDKTGKFVIPPQFDGAGNFTRSGLAAVNVGSVLGYIDAKGKVIINPQWSRAESFRQVGGAWLAIVGVAEEGSEKVRYGLIDTKGAYKINPQFDDLGSFSPAGFAVAPSSELQGAVDVSGRYVLQPVYTTLLPIKGTSKFIFVKPIAGAKDMQEIGVVDSAGNVTTSVRGGVCGGIYSFG